MQLTTIYAHLEPAEDEIRYIGKSDFPERRLKDHLREADIEHHHRACWLRSLKAQGLCPRLEVIAEVPVEEWKFWERHYIKYFRECGFDLVNTAEGGDGDGVGRGADNPNFGKPSHPHTRAALLRANIGRKKTPEEIEKIRASLLGRAPEPHVLAAAIKKNTGGVLSSQTKLKIGKANRAALTGKKHPEATSQYYSVFWNKVKSRWVAIVKVDGHKNYLGSFLLELDAARAVDVFIRERGLSLKLLNFP